MTSRALVLYLASCLAAAAALTNPVRTTTGLLLGVPGRDAKVTAFKGIPFASPPVGDLRWRAPRPPKSWEGVRKSADFGPGCVQNVPGTRPPWTEEFMHQGAVSEDCLFLNLWTGARKAGEKRPVLVFFHGGGFNEGSGSIATYDGEQLARQGLVMITANYRVGALGFLAYPELSTESDHKVSGNYGILDMIAALRWIQQNVEGFGGDPNRVTIAGQSAGAMAVHVLMASPLATGLFHRAMAQSGSGTGRLSRTLRDAEQAGVKFAESRGTHTLAELRAKEAKDLIASGFGPVMDGWLFPSSGIVNDVPVLTGLNADEGSAGPTYGKLDAAQFANQAQQRYGGKAQAFLALYLAADQIEAARDQGRVSMYLWAVNRDKSSKTKTFTYYFTHAMPGPAREKFGAFHTGEIPYVFMNLVDKPDRPWTDEDRRIARTISAYWVNFVTRGDPNGRGLPAWPPFDPRQSVTMEIGDHFGPIPTAPATKLEFFRDALLNPPPAAR